MVEEETGSNKKSALALRVAALKKSIDNSISKNSRLPQPLFWSLFNARLKDIKRDKEIGRNIQELLSSNLDPLPDKPDQTNDPENND